MAIQLKVSRTIGAPPDEVFAVFTDLPRAHERVSAIHRIDLLTEGPVRAGTRYKETRRMFGREATEEMEIVDFVPGERYTIECRSCGSLVRSTFRFMPESGATRVELEVEARAESLFAKALMPFFGRTAMKSVRQAAERDLDDLARAVEEEAEARSMP